jgi:hypothetical protein
VSHLGRPERLFNQSLPSEIDWSFFLVTVDLWSADAKQEMNLVLHPSSTDRYMPTLSSKNRRRGASTNQSQQSQSGPQTPVQPSPAPSYRPPEQVSFSPTSHSYFTIHMVRRRPPRLLPPTIKLTSHLPPHPPNMLPIPMPLPQQTRFLTRIPAPLINQIHPPGGTQHPLSSIAVQHILRLPYHPFIPFPRPPLNPILGFTLISIIL